MLSEPCNGGVSQPQGLDLAARMDQFLLPRGWKFTQVLSATQFSNFARETDSEQ